MTIERMTKQYISILKINMVDEENLMKIWIYLLEEIKHNDLMSEVWKDM